MRRRRRRSGSRAHHGFNDSNPMNRALRRTPMSTSNEFVNVALLTAVFVGLSFLSRLF
jgi:hypothetical protein